jgi:LuxR family maltose regulon positive regulatory protein
VPERAQTSDGGDRVVEEAPFRLDAAPVRRARLLQTLKVSGDARVITVQAPPGYGKTTLIQQWTSEDRRPGILIRVRPYAADGPGLAEEIAAALVGPHEGPVLPIVHDEASWFSASLPALGQIVASKEQPFILVLDDFSAVSRHAAAALVTRLTVSLPPNSQLVILSRERTLHVADLLALNTTVLELGPRDLAFDREEAEELLIGLGVHMTPAELDRLLERREGWPVAVYLLGLAARTGEVDPDTGSRLTARLTEYLHDELFDVLGPRDQELLLHASILDVVSGPACDALLASTGTRRKLRELAARNRLIAPLDDSGKTFRLHPLFSDFLQAEFMDRSPAAYRAAHGAASHLYAAEQRWDEAVRHAIRAGDVVELGELVWTYAASLLGRGQVSVLQRWLSEIDERTLISNVRLTLVAAQVAIHAGNSARMREMAMRAQGLLERDHRDHPASGDLDLLLAIIGRDGPEGMIQLSRQAAEGMAADDMWRTVASYLNGIAHLLDDRFPSGVAHLHEGAGIAEALDVPIMHALCLSALSQVHVAEGRSEEARELVSRAIEIVARANAASLAVTAPVYTAAAVVLAGGGDPRAADVAGQALRLVAAISGTAFWIDIMGRVQLGQAFLMLGDPAQARTLLEEAQTLYRTAPRAPLLARSLEALAGAVSGVNTTASTAGTVTTAELRVLQYLPTHFSYPEIAGLLGVAPTTVKSQVGSVFRKLGVRTRSDAVVSARRARLLTSSPDDWFDIVVATGSSTS